MHVKKEHNKKKPFFYSQVLLSHPHDLQVPFPGFKNQDSYNFDILFSVFDTLNEIHTYM